MRTFQLVWVVLIAANQWLNGVKTGIMKLHDNVILDTLVNNTNKSQ